MGLFTLYAGLLLPWLGGTLWLVFVESHFAPETLHNRVRQAGYGFFLGYAVLFLAVLANNRLTGTTSWQGLMLFFAVLALAGGLAVWLTRGSPLAVPAAPKSPASPAIKMLTGLVVLWMAAHLIFIVVDIFNQPVYPWDAWLAWIYRAKAWYLSGGLSAVVAPAEWATATAGNIYTIDAWLYPLFPSVIPYWSALSLGYWSETLVNLPVLFAGIAIGMALYGQCREYGLGVTRSLVCVYLLYSIPIFATHIALAGYADIWMAGFCGLGFIAVIRASSIRATNPQNHYRTQMFVGLLLLAFAVLVKNEGLVWLLAALAMLAATTYRARTLILAVVAVAVFVLFFFAIGITHLNLWLIGQIGVVDGRLVIPFIGNFALELHNVWQVYWTNFFTMGSWNLLWILVLTSLAMATRSNTNPTQRIGLTFISVFLASQLFIFGFTDQGLWADTYTAINRLPIHFVPALLFTSFIIIFSIASEGATHSAGREPTTPAIKPSNRKQQGWQLVPPLLAATIVFAGLFLFLASDLPDSPADAIDYPATDFKFAFGSGHPEKDRLFVSEFANGYALLSSGPVNIAAESYPVLTYDWVPTQPDQEAAFFWRQKDNADQVARTDITSPGTQLLDLSANAEWHGEIIEYGYLLAGQEDQPVEIGQTTLEPDRLGIRLRLMWQVWTVFEERSQQTINFLQGGDYRQVVRLPSLVILWLLVSLILIRYWPGKTVNNRSFSFYAGVLFLTCWMLLDIRWSANGFRQARLTLQASPGNSLDAGIYQYVQGLKSDVFGDMAARILIIGDENAIDYYLLRAKYHLLPHSISVVTRLSKQIPAGSVDFIIFFGEPGGLKEVPGWNPSWRKTLVKINSGDWGTVYRTNP